MQHQVLCRFIREHFQLSDLRAINRPSIRPEGVGLSAVSFAPATGAKAEKPQMVKSTDRLGVSLRWMGGALRRTGLEPGRMANNQRRSIAGRNAERCRERTKSQSKSDRSEVGAVDRRCEPESPASVEA